MVPANFGTGTAASQSNRIAVLVVDDQPIVRYGLCHLINGQADMEITATTTDCSKAWECLGSAKPHVLLIDVQLNDRCAQKLIEKITDDQLDIRILVYSSGSAELQVLEAIRSGAHGYITKDADPERLCNAIRVIACGGYYLDSNLAGMVIGHLGRKVERRDMNRRMLTERESIVLRALATGKRNKEIASQMFITERTVKFHISSVFQKMKVRNRTEAVQFAFKNGII